MLTVQPTFSLRSYVSLQDGWLDLPRGFHLLPLENMAFRSYLWQDIFIFSGELQAQFQGTKEGLNLCAPGNSEDQDTGQSHGLIFVYYLDVRARRNLRRSAGQILTFLSSFFERPLISDIPSLCCHSGTVLNAMLS